MWGFSQVCLLTVLEVALIKVFLMFMILIDCVYLILEGMSNFRKGLSLGGVGGREGCYTCKVLTNDESGRRWVIKVERNVKGYMTTIPNIWYFNII